MKRSEAIRYYEKLLKFYGVCSFGRTNLEIAEKIVDNIDILDFLPPAIKENPDIPYGHEAHIAAINIKNNHRWESEDD